jgi:TetR/AcrR family transcriptional regulator
VKQPPGDLARRLADASEEILRPGQELRLEDIAALTGTARATLYYYFSGRDDLLAFLLSQHMTAAGEAITAAASPGQPPGARLRAMVTALVAFLGGRPGVCAGLLSFAGSAGRLGPVMAVKDAMLAAPLAGVIRDGIQASQFPATEPDDAASAILGAAMIATLARWERGGDSTSPAFQQALTEQIVRGVLPA